MAGTGAAAGMGVAVGAVGGAGVMGAGTTGPGTTGAGALGAGALGAGEFGEVGEIPGRGVTGAGVTGSAWARTTVAPKEDIKREKPVASNRPVARTSIVIVVTVLLHSLFNLTLKWLLRFT